MIYKHIITVDYVVLKLMKKRGKKNGSSRLLRWRGFNGLIIDLYCFFFLTSFFWFFGSQLVLLLVVCNLYFVSKYIIVNFIFSLGIRNKNVFQLRLEIGDYYWRIETFAVWRY